MSEVLNMSNIMILRMLICENITLTFDYPIKPQFVLKYETTVGLWSVKVGHGWNYDPPILFGCAVANGEGETPELAYQDVLKATAIRASKYDYNYSKITFNR
ncbi:hypothetical protein M436DRAFT_77934 [Aureobasidium namibiae CBS 147.97]|uniref:Uncharacterized protein n=1 Tax=Aureobasidium namibiae CBS 147.97 TaxID=1043004 RepID=A0A074WY29_9PEZI